MRPAHLITRDQVDAWLADSVNRRITYHRTSVAAADNILRRGVDLGRSRVGAYGLGFYTATQSDPLQGPAELAVAVRLLRPLQESATALEALIDELSVLATGQQRPLLTPRVAAQVRRELLALGYDGLIVQDGGGDGIDYVIALQSSAVKVVQ